MWERASVSKAGLSNTGGANRGGCRCRLVVMIVELHDGAMRQIVIRCKQHKQPWRRLPDRKRHNSIDRSEEHIKSLSLIDRLSEPKTENSLDGTRYKAIRIRTSKKKKEVDTSVECRQSYKKDVTIRVE